MYNGIRNCADRGSPGLHTSSGGAIAMQISKSEYMMYLKQPAWLWLKKHDKKVLPAPDRQLQALFNDGNILLPAL